MTTPTIARHLIYVLSEADAIFANRRRTTFEEIRDRINTNTWPLGAQAHIGNEAKAGQEYPAIVVAVADGRINLRAFLDGSDELWVQDAKEGDLPGTWHWPKTFQAGSALAQPATQEEKPAGGAPGSKEEASSAKAPAKK